MSGLASPVASCATSSLARPPLPQVPRDRPGRVSLTGRGEQLEAERNTSRETIAHLGGGGAVTGREVERGRACRTPGPQGGEATDSSPAVSPEAVRSPGQTCSGCAFRRGVLQRLVRSGLQFCVLRIVLADVWGSGGRSAFCGDSGGCSRSSSNGSAAQQQQCQFMVLVLAATLLTVAGKVAPACGQ